ncbi:hypothetical protein M409DRAFT_20956 [Zasmidium cellare ATCC 36951]|uniref:Uncharacterized protein n=1 Tax=Zasmidium cellare ATCC 36951 TaxID=1080233 RepID=A0A6A6CSY2_ZASCE|nr:uncharacterized protein M409DRAFT_20956 [Zasmidium cellare ATCC 36951]KAF2168942.1 hypothetical protein M409DRAFT_20956 [Zasmidium cellare ATCC 36951]
MNILITGASRGIGHSTALLAGSKPNWNIGINYLRDAHSANSAVEEINTNNKTKTSSGGKAIALRGDISDEKDVHRIFSTFEEGVGGKIDGVVIKAGITAPALPLVDMSVERLKRMFDTNVLGAYLCAREAVRRIPQDSNGSIVIVSSGASRLGSPNEYVDYAGSKGAMDTLTIGLSKELGPRGVRVNAVRPGVIRTEIHEKGTGDAGRVERLGGQTPLGRAGEAEEVARAVVWLLGSEASYVTGALLDVAGGR